MTQASLLDWNADNHDQLERVRSKLELSVLSFLRLVLEDRDWPLGPGIFQMEDLTKHVQRTTGVAPDSPGRILRSLRQNGRCHYRVTDRRRSTYEVLWVNP